MTEDYQEPASLRRTTATYLIPNVASVSAARVAIRIGRQFSGEVDD
jgi:hypothetical protein